jgi:hypothetical protein
MRAALETSGVGSEVQQRRTGRSAREANRETLERAGCEQRRDPIGDQEQHATARARGQTFRHHSPTAYVIGQRAEQQQPDRRNPDVGDEQRRQSRRRESELGLMDPVEAEAAVFAAKTRNAIAAATQKRHPTRQRPQLKPLLPDYGERRAEPASS